MADFGPSSVATRCYCDVPKQQQSAEIRAPGRVQAILMVGERTESMSSDPSLISLVNVVLRRRAIVAWTVLIAVVVVALFGLVPRRRWTATATFVPQGKQNGAGVQALAAQFGLPVAAGDPNESPAFYADLVKSREIVGGVVDSGVVVAGNRVDIADHFDLKAKAPGLRRDDAIRRLTGELTVTTNAKTGVVSVGVSLTDPQLAAAVGERVIELLNRFNLETRRSRAAAERRFAAERLREVQGDLREVEDSLQRFLQRNRDFRNSPELLFQQERLARSVGLQQTLYTTLAQSHEQAKLDEVRDTPVITVLERPEVPVRPDRRGLVGKGIVAVIAGSLLGALIALLLESAAPSGVSPDQARREFARLFRDTLRDLRRPWRLFRRNGGSSAPPPATPA